MSAGAGTVAPASRLDAQPAADFATQRAVERFLHHEARLLDAGEFTAWLDLFGPDGRYWVPSRPGQTDPETVASIIYEDSALLEMRVRRFAHPRAYAARPQPRTTHLVGNIEIVGRPYGPDTYEVESALIVTEYREAQRRWFSGRCRHVLRRQDDGFRIVLKRVDLTDCDGIHGAISILF